MSEWQLQEARNRFSEVLRRAAEEGPQTVAIHGKPAAVVLSAAAYAELAAGRKLQTPVTRNQPDFGDAGVDILHPWAD